MCMCFILLFLTLQNYINILLPRIAPLTCRLFLRKPQNKNNDGIKTAASHLQGEITECSKEI